MNPRYATITAPGSDTRGDTSAICGKAPSLTNTAGHTSANLAKCREMLEEIELTLFGPEPACKGESGSPPRASSLDSILCENAEESASIAVRLETIASRIGRRDSR